MSSIADPSPEPGSKVSSRRNPAPIAAPAMAASRVVGNHHYFSDVMAGAVIGRFFGRIFTMHHGSPRG